MLEWRGSSGAVRCVVWKEALGTAGGWGGGGQWMKFLASPGWEAGQEIVWLSDQGEEAA